MSESLVNFWKRFKLTDGTLQIHPDDEKWMKDHWAGALRSRPYSNWEQYVQGDRFGRNDNDPHLSLMPVPYMGNLAKASILLFLANPGFADGEYYFEFCPGVRERLLKNIYQEEGDDYPFIYLDPSLAWSGGYQWWNQRFKPLIQLLTNRSRSPQEAQHFLARQIAVVELFPYHSIDGGRLKGVGSKKLLPSVEKAKEFLAESSGNPNQLKVVLRGHDKWNHESCAPQSAHYVHAPKHQTITLNPKLEELEPIWRWLSREI